MSYKKRTTIYYNYNGEDVQFAFEEGFHGAIEGPPGSLLRCYVLNDEKDAIVVYITEKLGAREVLRLILPK